MKVGDRVTVFPYIGDKDKAPARGTVIYINRAHRFYTVRLDAGYCQCFAKGTSE